MDPKVGCFFYLDLWHADHGFLIAAYNDWTWFMLITSYCSSTLRMILYAKLKSEKEKKKDR